MPVLQPPPTLSNPALQPNLPHLHRHATNLPPLQKGPSGKQLPPLSSSPRDLSATTSAALTGSGSDFLIPPLLTLSSSR